MGIPQHSRYLVDRLLQAYCARVCPPTARHTVLLGYTLESDHAVIHEWRAICGVDHLRRPEPVAKFSYLAQDRVWELSSRQHGSWQRHARLHRSASFIDLLREFDADPMGEFWGRIDGKSLRWCQSAGRCQRCEQRYGEILGLGASVAPRPNDLKEPRLKNYSEA
jgi:hypothetical protein